MGSRKTKANIKKGRQYPYANVLLPEDDLARVRAVAEIEGRSIPAQLGVFARVGLIEYERLLAMKGTPIGGSIQAQELAESVRAATP